MGKLTTDLIDRVSNLAFGCATVGFGMSVGGAAAPGVIAAGGAGAVVLMGLAFAARAKHGTESTRLLKKIRKRIREQWRQDQSFSHYEQSELDRVSKALGQLLPECMLSPPELAVLAVQADRVGFPESATQYVLTALTKKQAEFGQKGLACEFTKFVVFAAFSAAIEDENYFRKLHPHLLIQKAETMGHMLVYLEEQDQQLNRIEGLLETFQESSLKPETLITLARRLPDSGGDADSLVQGLVEALEAAEELLRLGNTPNNLDQFADMVFKRIAKKIEANDLDGAAEEARNGFADWKIREAERAKASLQTGIAIIDAGIKANILRCDARAVATFEFNKIRLQFREKHQWDAIVEIQNIYLNDGKVRGLLLDIDIAVELSRILVIGARNRTLIGYSQIYLGNALLVKGKRGDNIALEKAIIAYRSALMECTQGRTPLDWAMTQNNLGTAFLVQGERGDKTALNMAITAFRAALMEYTQESNPLRWSTTQNNLCGALLCKARQGDKSALEEAIVACRLALQELTPEQSPLDWARTKNNLGSTLLSKSRLRGSKVVLDEAIVNLRAALEVYTKEGFPLDWAMTQNNLGNALCFKVELGDDVVVNDAIEAYRGALEEYTREQTPLKWANTQNNLGNALKIKSEHGDDEALEGAIEAFRISLEERTQQRVPLSWAMTQNNLGNALLIKGKRGDMIALEDAINAYRAALDEYTQERVPIGWAKTQMNLGVALLAKWERVQDIRVIKEALSSTQRALTVFKEFKTEAYIQSCQTNIRMVQNALKSFRPDS